MKRILLIQIILVVFFLALNQATTQQYSHEAKNPELINNCLKKSECEEDFQCQIEFEHCSKCSELPVESELQQNINKEKYECYYNCFYNNIDQEDNEQISQGAFDFLWCAKQIIYDHEDFRQPKNVYVIQKHHLIKNVFKQPQYYNWNIVENPKYTNWHFKWDFYHHRLNFNPSNKKQIGNKLPNVQQVLGDKVSFFQLLQNYDKNDFYTLKSSQFLPETYIAKLLTQPDAIENKLYQDKRPFWIVKSPSGYGGDGITIHKDIKSVKTNLQKQRQIVQKKYHQDEEVRSNKGQQETDAVIQKYIENPMLIDKRKFDIRNFVLIACTEPYFILYKPGYFRFTYEDFDMKIEPFNLQAQIKHLTNTSMQKNSNKWNNPRLRDQHGMRHEEAMEKLKQQYSYTDKEIQQLNQQIEDVLTYCMQASLEHLQKSKYQFQFLGMDFMLDTDKKLYFLEANQNPRLQEEFRGEREVSPDLAQSIVELELQLLDIDDIQERTRILKQHTKYFNLGGWKVLINEANNYNLLDDQSRL